MLDNRTDCELVKVGKMTEYSFNIEHAIKYGVENAVMIRFFQFWITTNKANNRNNIEGRTWTYNSLDALQKIMPFWSRRQLERILSNLQTENIIIKGNFNKVKIDRTVWYAFKNEADFIPLEKLSKIEENPKSSISPNRDMDFTKQGNVISPNRDMSFHQTVTPIPVNNHISNKDILNLLPHYIDSETFLAYIDFRKAKKLSNSMIVIQRLLHKIESEHANGNNPNEMIMKAITNGWKDLYLTTTENVTNKKVYGGLI